jgi:hypothetical protein
MVGSFSSAVVLVAPVGIFMLLCCGLLRRRVAKRRKREHGQAGKNDRKIKRAREGEREEQAYAPNYEKLSAAKQEDRKIKREREG